MTLFTVFLISCKLLYLFRVKHSPIIRSSIKLYLQHLMLTNGNKKYCTKVSFVVTFFRINFLEFLSYSWSPDAPKPLVLI
jgi:hypothetical protein